MNTANILPNFWGRVSTSRAPYPFIILVTAGIVFLLTFATKGLLLHGTFNTAAYDLGIFDQACWVAV